MNIFFIINNDKQEGPFSIEELKAKGISHLTLVWTEGLNQWTEAQNIPALINIISKKTSSGT